MAKIDSSKNAFITLDHITIRLRDRFVLENTFWNIKDDQHWAIIGPNGAGKSTLVKAISGEVPVIRGEIVYHYPHGKSFGPLSHLHSIARISFDLQRDFFEQNNVQGSFGNSDGRQKQVVAGKEIVASGLSSHHPNITMERRLKEIVQRLDIERLLNRDINSISSGEARKLVIARALMKWPKLLILDEPFEGLDNKSRNGLKRLIGQLMAGRMRVMLVTHRFDEIGPQISHVLCLKNCSVYSQGRKEKILTSHNIKHLYAEEIPSSLHKKVQVKQNENRGTVNRKPLVRMENTRVMYRDSVVLENINWKMRQGENWAILGPNGSGKTKLLQLITGDNLQAYANEIYLFGKKRGTGESIWDIRSKVSIISSEYQIYYQTGTVAYDVICSGFFDSVGLYRYCTPEQHDKVKKWIEFLQLADMVEKKMDQLSYGQQRMVLLARAVVKSPLLLLLDDPCDGLDIVNRLRILGLIQFIGSKTQTHLIYVTHHESEIPECITHVLVLDRGRIVRKGKKVQVLSRSDKK